MLAYMQKNKDWCQIPDEAIGQLKETHAKSVAFGGKACTVAAQLRTMKAKAAQRRSRPSKPGAASLPNSRCPPVRFEGAERRRTSGRAARQSRPAPRAGLRDPLRAARALGPSDRLGIAARALLVGDRARRASPRISGPNFWHLALFLIGAIAMRGAGCTYNDILDRDLDAGVERTRGRPLPSGRATAKAAAAFMAAQSLVGLAVLLCFNRFTIGGRGSLRC